MRENAHKNCLICFKNVNPEEGVDKEKNVQGLSTSSRRGGREIQPLTLFQLVQHPKSVGSPAHQNIIQGYEGEGTCALCHKCAALSKDLEAVGGQIIALQAVLRGMVEIIRGRIVESDGEIRSKGLSQQDEGLDGLLAIRQSLLILSDDETDNFSQVNAEVKIKIEDEAAYFLDGFQSHPDEDDEFVKQEALDDGKADSDCSFSINPQRTWRNNRVSKRKMTEDDLTPIPFGIKEDSTENSFHISSSSDIDQELECDPLEMDDKLKEEKEGDDEVMEEDSPNGTITNNVPPTAQYHPEVVIRSLPSTSRAINKRNQQVASTLPILQGKIPKRPPNNRLSPCTLETPALPNDSPTSLLKKKNTKKKKTPDHITVISGPTTYQCNVCMKKFKTKTHVKYHEFCKNGKTPFQCEECGQGFITRQHYEYHLRTHTGERPYVCPTCGKGFNQKAKVTRHLLSHTGEKPFVCDDCGKGFANAHALKSHELIHTGERPFACEFCNKRFTVATNLKKHILTHTGERPYVCAHCGKSFAVKWTLDLHLKTHSGERPYACDQCTRAFSSSKDLRRHLVIHSEQRPFECCICGTTFRRKDNLDRHIKTHIQPK